MKRPAADPLQAIPGVGPSIAADLRELGVQTVADLYGRDPERMYENLIARRGAHQDRCLLYVFRCAVHFASKPDAPPETLRWWYWKDRA
ncbi:MAG TPA: helix-hairpin-helix domain-containing protein [Rhodanobacteraceae bacterium]|nr:helix-hairpin-helix domain-containing protein [Rhodanobacteraceae bacterium]